jgi:SAM-dependent methyltransferase
MPDKIFQAADWNEASESSGARAGQFGSEYFRRWNYADRPLGRFSMYWFARRYYAGLVCKFGPPAGKLLELGCGLGDLLALLEHRYDCTGLDIAEYCVAETGRRAKRAAVLQGDAQDLSGFADAELASVVALHLVEHLVDPRKTIEEVSRILRPGGLWLFATPDPEYSWRRFKDPRTDAIGKDPTHINVQPREVWRRWCQEAGFEVVRHFADGLWDVPYFRFVPTSLQFAVLGVPSLVQVLTRTALVPLGMGVNQIVIARKSGGAATLDRKQTATHPPIDS